MAHRTTKRNEYRRRLDVSSLRVMAPTWTPPITGPVGVVSVQVVSTHTLRWTFSVPITAIPAVAAVAPLKASDGTVEDRPPTAVSASGSAALLLSYADCEFSSDPITWTATAAPVGLTFAGGVTLAVPQSGRAANPITLSAKPKRSKKKRPKPPSAVASIPTPSLPSPHSPASPKRRAA